MVANVFEEVGGTKLDGRIQATPVDCSLIVRTVIFIGITDAKVQHEVNRCELASRSIA